MFAIPPTLLLELYQLDAFLCLESTNVASRWPFAWLKESIGAIGPLTKITVRKHVQGDREGNNTALKLLEMKPYPKSLPQVSHHTMLHSRTLNSLIATKKFHGISLKCPLYLMCSGNSVLKVNDGQAHCRFWTVIKSNPHQTDAIYHLISLLVLCFVTQDNFLFDQQILRT